MQLIARAAITFEAVDGQTQHAPLVIGTLGGVTTRFVLDTGSDVHLLNEDLADRLGLDKVPGEEGVDHGGATMPSWDVGVVGMELGGIQLTLRDVVAIPAPPPFPGWGIGGILAPQALHSTAATVMDLIDDELILVKGSDDELESFLRDRTPELALLRLQRDVAFSNVVVPAAIEGYAETSTLIDTGAKRTEASASAMAGMLAEGSETLGTGVGGNDYAGSFAGEQTLVVAGHRMRVPDLAIRVTMHDTQCLVGIDVLRHTVLTCSTDLGRPVFWQFRAK